MTKGFSGINNLGNPYLVATYRQALNLIWYRAGGRFIRDFWTSPGISKECP
jgi:hypothetical protein